MMVMSVKHIAIVPCTSAASIIRIESAADALVEAYGRVWTTRDVVRTALHCRWHKKIGREKITKDLSLSVTRMVVINHVRN